MTEEKEIGVESKEELVDTLKKTEEIAEKKLKEVQQETDEESVKRFLAEDRVQVRGKETATFLFSIFKTQTFDVEKMKKKTQWVADSECLEVLQLLQLLGLVAGWYDSSSQKYKFKITQTDQDRVEVYSLQILALEEQKKSVENSISILKNKINEFNTSKGDVQKDTK